MFAQILPKEEAALGLLVEEVPEAEDGLGAVRGVAGTGAKKPRRPTNPAS